MLFDGKTVIITGGASGIGLLCGQCYAKEGANVVLVDVSTEQLDKCVEDLKKDYPNVIGACIDIRNYDDVARVCKETSERFGSIDILINCAGGSEMRVNGLNKEFKDVPIEIYDWGIDVNLKGAFYFDHAAMKYMADRMSGVIIHMGSITGEEGDAQSVAYSTSKSALMNGLTKSIALQGAKYNVRCVCIAPGPVLTRPAMANMKTLLGRAARPQEIVDMILFVTGKTGEYINGTTILIDGGRNIMRNKG